MMQQALVPEPNGLLTNNQAKHLSSELVVTHKRVSSIVAQHKVIKNKDDLAALNTRLLHKFTMTEDGTFAVLSAISDVDLPSHATGAELSGLTRGNSNLVVSAGYVFKSDEIYYLNNHSGHYQPPHDRLLVAQEHLSQLGVNVRTIRSDFDFPD